MRLTKSTIERATYPGEKTDQGISRFRLWVA